MCLRTAGINHVAPHVVPRSGSDQERCQLTPRRPREGGNRCVVYHILHTHCPGERCIKQCRSRADGENTSGEITNMAACANSGGVRVHVTLAGCAVK